jgi:hypothetical protein
MVDWKIFRPEDIQRTYFADPQRASAKLLEYQINLACSHPVITELLLVFGGVVLVLNEFRQAVAVNDIFLRTLGIEDPKDVLVYYLRKSSHSGKKFMLRHGAVV